MFLKFTYHADCVTKMKPRLLQSDDAKATSRLERLNHRGFFAKADRAGCHQEP